MAWCPAPWSVEQLAWANARSLTYVSFAVGSISQVLALLFGHLLRPSCAKDHLGGWWRSSGGGGCVAVGSCFVYQEMAFFDKCCICQYDEAL